MSLAAKISAGFLILMASMVGLSWYQLAMIYRLHAESRELARIDLEASSLALGLQGRVARLRQLGHKFLLLRDPGYAAELRRLRQQSEEDLDRLRALDLGAGERQTLEQLQVLWDGYAAEADANEGEVLDRRAADVEGLRAELDRRLDALADQLDRLLAVARDSMETRVVASADRVERARRVAWAATAAGLAVAALISLGIVRSLVRPLRQLARGTHELAGGHLDYRVPVEGGPELEALAEDFNAMAHHLGELDQLKKDFVANVSHDLKAPLASIQEATEVLLEGIPGPLEDRQRRLLELNLESGQRLTRMIGDLLDLSRLETGTVSYDLQRHDLAELAHGAVETLAALIADKRLELEEDFPAAPVEVECDGTAIVKVAQNLLSNAVKFTPAGGRIRLRIRRIEDAGELPAASMLEDDASAVLLEVGDSGPGVPDDHKQRIFERFHRIESGGGGPQGTGLGLAITREIVGGHGGAVWVEDGAGGGSVFKVLLGRRTPPSAPSAAAAEEGYRAAVRNRSTAAATALLCLLVTGVPLLGGCRPAATNAVEAGPLEIGDAHFERGDFPAASDAYETWLAQAPLGPPEDQVLFRMALMRTLPGSPIRDARRARRYFTDLVERYPQSPLRAAADYLLGLQREVEELRHQLEEIKRIDLGG
jgi:two-component system sensor histidine kinase GlrK